MTPDKLFGAAAAYLLIGNLWAYVYASIGYFYPQSYMIVGQPGRLVYADALYFSLTVLTSTGFGDIAPLTRPARGMCMVQQITGSLFVAILIARLAGVYPPERVIPTADPRKQTSANDLIDWREPQCASSAPQGRWPAHLRGLSDG
ncbi:Ion channel [Caballeronia arvi]|uniref:Ion channel n=1 Tax=Caballeronia arvi TaxID=1777135 RepID=A0A158L3S3_9BURK|nr:potassium channel family protein [Caballeronia arvi]SAL87895.1 Ion channel [Caballeronia arvi]